VSKSIFYIQFGHDINYFCSIQSQFFFQIEQFCSSPNLDQI